MKSGYSENKINSNLISEEDSSGINIPQVTEGKLTELTPKKLSVDQSFWFIYDWVPRTDLIVSDYKGKKVWCNLIDHSIVEFSKVEINSNNCYLIPTTRLSEKATCCSPDECKGMFNEQIYSVPMTSSVDTRNPVILILIVGQHSQPANIQEENTISFLPTAINLIQILTERESVKAGRKKLDVVMEMTVDPIHVVQANPVTMIKAAKR